MYSNINPLLGIHCIEEFLTLDPDIPEAKKQFLVDSVAFILNNNYFEYDGSVYHQIKGTAMGTRIAPSYANHFMGIFESKFITSNNPFLSKIHIYRRYIDDLFILWEGNEREAIEFMDFLN